MKNRVMSFVLALALCLTLTACATKSSTSVEEPSSSKKVLTMAYVESNAFELWIKRFNESQDEYEIKPEDYAPKNEEYGIEDIRRKLIDRLAAGNGPDIIDLSTFNFAPDDPELNQYLEDLYPYLDSDPELNRENILQSYLGTQEVEDALYCTIGTVMVQAMVVSKKILNEDGQLGIQNFLNAAEAVGGARHLSCTTTEGLSLLSNLITYCLDHFVDLETGTSYFNTPEYHQLLEICAQAQDEVSDFYGQRDDSGVIYFDSVRSFYYPTLYRSMLGGDYAFSSELSLESYWPTSCDKLAMAAAGSEKEAVWDFIRVIFTPEYQLMSTIFPTNLDALETRAQMAREGVTTDNSYFMMNGVEHEGSTDLTPLTSFSVSDVEFGPVSEDDIQRVMDLLNSTTKTESSELIELESITLKHAAQYYNGDLTLDEAVAQTQADVEALLASQ